LCRTWTYAGPWGSPKFAGGQEKKAGARHGSLESKETGLNDSTDMRHAAAATANARVLCIFAAQQAAFSQRAFPSADERRGHLRALKRQP